ncbi:MAG: hypothetical protein JXA90_14365, partial [Planctomycetes bacterium]|nr:hypothetical protein [Planctomycetota bacterium]
MKTPPELSAVLEEEIARSGVPRGAQIDAVRELFELFTARRGGLGRWSYLDAPRLRLAYLRYHLPLNAARAECVLRDLLALRPEIGEIEHVVDLGAGPGSASVAALLTLPQRPRSFLLTDRSRAALRTARELLLRCAEKASAPAPAIRTVAQKLPALPRPVGKPCLLFLSMVINEISGPRGGMDLESLF